MRTAVTFRYPAEFVPVSYDDGILSFSGAGWFVSLLQRISDLEINPDLCQEDWGVVVIIRRNGKEFWIGLGSWNADDYTWHAHIHHHGRLSWLQRFSKSGKRELESFVTDIHKVLSTDSTATEIAWYDEHDRDRRKPSGCP